MTYQQWALIADIYTPVIALVCFISILRVMLKGSMQQGLMRLVLVILSTIFIYTMMFIDNILHIWPAFGLDYSTHTAIALVFVAYFIVYKSRLMHLIVISMFSYALIMVHQHYHTVADILTTTVFILPVLLLIQSRKFTKC
ncbi:hypothetical protein CTM94_01845 [Photobacterium leiognathi]|uniref:Sphingomyelin synthase-like domain-containing protein n=1 Tax=Photobacterium leiognathi TaxID=553611 RepID=A0ABX5GL17_PHOLE|nr:hypothetical protein [Photobacterium leiognathi]KJF91914.1 membrane protein [Photobacterium leiognathi]PSV86569.1 hypothetical protein CTM94_01845 [Photobacterium leiognathi]